MSTAQLSIFNGRQANLHFCTLQEAPSCLSSGDRLRSFEEKHNVAQGPCVPWRCEDVKKVSRERNALG